jgi:diguanylate cyclase (GGDEF)-like protein
LVKGAVMELNQSKTIRILVVEDERVVARDIKVCLESLGYTVPAIASSGADAIEKAQAIHPELVLMDIQLDGEMDGIQTAQQIWDTLQIPVIYATGHSDHATVERAINTEPFGYIVKPIKERDLHIAIKMVLQRYQLFCRGKTLSEVPTETQQIEQLQRENQQLQHLINLDALTQIPNRRYFDSHLVTEWKRMLREACPLSLVFCDIDYFKVFNDTFGHLAGDECLRQVAQVISQVLKRPGDLAARYGGEEFAIILPRTNAMGAMEIAEALRLAVRQINVPLQCPEKWSLPRVTVTVSVGVATTIPYADLSSNDLIMAADKALYQSKQQGRDRTTLSHTLNFRC